MISPVTLLIGMVLALLILRAVHIYVSHPLRLVLSIVVIVAFVVMLFSALRWLGPLS